MIKNIPPIAFYFASIVAFVFANISKEHNVAVYYGFLAAGALLFLLGLLNKMKKQ